MWAYRNTECCVCVFRYTACEYYLISSIQDRHASELWFRQRWISLEVLVKSWPTLTCSILPSPLKEVRWSFTRSLCRHELWRPLGLTTTRCKGPSPGNTPGDQRSLRPILSLPSHIGYLETTSRREAVRGESMWDTKKIFLERMSSA